VYIDLHGGREDKLKFADGFWHLIGYRVNYNKEAIEEDNIVAESTTARIYIDDEFASDESVGSKRAVYIDSVSFTHTLGA
jgi:hypothetical protein